LTVLAALVLAVVAHPMVDILLGGGEFGPDDVNRTATVLTAYALSIPFDSLSYPLSRALYATHNTILQVIASIAGFGTVVLVGTVLAAPAGIVAIPLAAAAGGIVKVGLLTLFLIPRLRRIGSEGPAVVARELG
jgi:putative peptidoglycan lipid II flippase